MKTRTVTFVDCKITWKVENKGGMRGWGLHACVSLGGLPPTSSILTVEAACCDLSCYQTARCHITDWSFPIYVPYYCRLKGSLSKLDNRFTVEGMEKLRKDVQIWNGSNKISWSKKIFPRQYPYVRTNWCSDGNHLRPQTKTPSWHDNTSHNCYHHNTTRHQRTLKLSLCTLGRRMREAEEQLHSLTSALDQKTVESFTPRRLTPGERSPSTRWIACWEGHKTPSGR